MLWLHILQSINVTYFQLTNILMEAWFWDTRKYAFKTEINMKGGYWSELHSSHWSSSASVNGGEQSMWLIGFGDGYFILMTTNYQHLLLWNITKWNNSFIPMTIHVSCDLTKKPFHSNYKLYNFGYTFEILYGPSVSFCWECFNIRFKLEACQLLK